jgi:hypothetical protein
MPLPKLKIFGVAIVAIVALAVATIAKADGEAGVFVYEIQHPDHGAIGTHTNIVKGEAGTTVVNSRTRIAVKLGVFTLYQQEADRTEVWCDGRLKYYDSVTTTNGKDEVVRGWARSDQFVIDMDDTRLVAPADIVPTNPWFSGITDATTLISPVRGKIQNVDVKATTREKVLLANREIDAARFKIDGDLNLDIWYDDAGRLVKFTYPSKHDLLTFTLTERRGRVPDDVFQPTSCPAGESLARAELRKRPSEAAVSGPLKTDLRR